MYVLLCRIVLPWSGWLTPLQSKVVYIASLNDQVVPIYSGLFTAASHPRILRALYIDSDAYQYVCDHCSRNVDVNHMLQFI